MIQGQRRRYVLMDLLNVDVPSAQTLVDYRMEQTTATTMLTIDWMLCFKTITENQIQQLFLKQMDPLVSSSKINNCTRY